MFDKIKYQREYKQTKLKQGLCLSCGINRLKTATACASCQAKNLARTRKLHELMRIEVLKQYGNKCACCNESQAEFLQIDHINNNGAEHRRKVKTNLYLWLKRNNYPKDNFQLLCANCNWAKEKYKICPHKRMMFGEGDDYIQLH